MSALTRTSSSTPGHGPGPGQGASSSTTTQPASQSTAMVPATSSNPATSARLLSIPDTLKEHITSFFGMKEGVIFLSSCKGLHQPRFCLALIAANLKVTPRIFSIAKSVHETVAIKEDAVAERRAANPPLAQLPLLPV